MKANAAELTVARDMGDPDPVPFVLNEYGDFSTEEFDNVQNGADYSTVNLEQANLNPNNGYVDPNTPPHTLENSVDEHDRIRQKYTEWCFMYQKTYDESRLGIFAANLKVVEDYCTETGKHAELNEYANLSPEEYNSVAVSARKDTTTQSQQNANVEAMSTNRQTTASTLHQYFDDDEVQRIRQEYLYWCGFNGKEYSESRLDIFATNFLAFESYCAETGQNAILNSNADLLPEEYDAMVSSGIEAPPSKLNSSSSSVGQSNYAINNQDDSTVIASGENNQGASSSEPPLVVSQTVVDQGIRAVYQDWCEYYEKESSEDGLHHFTKNYLVLEKHHRETGEELTLNEYADTPNEVSLQDTEKTGPTDEETRLEQEINLVEEQCLDEARLEEERRKKGTYRLEGEARERMEKARRNEEQRRKAEEQMRIETERKRMEEEARSRKEEEERAKFEEAKKRVEEAQLLEQKQAAAAAQAALEKRKASTTEKVAAPQESAAIDTSPRPSDLDLEKNRLRQERIRLEEALEFDKNLLKKEKESEEEARIALGETDRQILDMIKEDEQDMKSASDFLSGERMRLEDSLKYNKASLQKEAARVDDASETLKETDRQIYEIIGEDEQDLKSETDRLQEEQMVLEDTLQYEQERLEEETLRKDEVRKSLEEIDREIENIIQEDEEDMNSEKLRLQQERIMLEQALKTDRALLKEERRLEEKARKALEETDSRIDEIMKENELDTSETADAIILPRASYMDAVAKTWVDRTAYLEKLKQGRAGALPYNPDYAKTSSEKPAVSDRQAAENYEQLKIKQSESLIDSVWNFMKENNTNEMGSENYSKSLIKQADELIAETTTDSTVVMGEELQYLKKAVDAMRRRNHDDMAADRARTEAKEWEQIQKGLEKEAKLAKERRDNDERIAKEARQKARALKAERREHERRAEKARRREQSLRDKNRETLSKIRSLETAFEENSDGQVQGNPFSFFTGPAQNGSESATENKKENIFSFFRGSESDTETTAPPSASSTQAVKIEKKESWIDAVFGFFAGEAIEDKIPGQGTITLEPAKQPSVFDFFISPDSIAPEKLPGQGSITIDDSQESIFSFFSKFGVSKKKEKAIDPVRRKRVMDYESKLRSRQEKLSLLKAGRSRILNEKDKKLSRKEARRLQRELDALATGDSTPASSICTSGIPQLAKWIQTPEGRITGWISDAAGGRYKMGTRITTSRINQKVVKPGMTVTTLSGSQYRLGMTAARDVIDSSSNNRRKDGTRADNLSSPIGSLFGRLFYEENVPTLVEWIQNEDGTITGFVNNKDGFEDGTQVTTSPVKMGARKGMVIETKGGSKYKLLREKN
mmetsp:Transcript_5877/g.14635  ORF Transcript_5877/g.14635 Transcript_5877/m.14635 type:complete len:1341 (+) Transcript_5877:3-4025(+)